MQSQLTTPSNAVPFASLAPGILLGQLAYTTDQGLVSWNGTVWISNGSTVTAPFTGAFTGTTTDPAPVCEYTKGGSIVVLQLPLATATSNATTFTITGVPAIIRPTNTQVLVGRTTNSGTIGIGTIAVDSTGVMTMGTGGTGTGPFASTGTKGIPAQTVVYSLD